MSPSIREEAQLAAQLVADAGGVIVGRTRLQKIAYLLEVMGYGYGFDFHYKHYGPFSERLSSALKTATVFDFVEEDVRSTAWGGYYSVFRSLLDESDGPEERKNIMKLGVDADPVELELAATAVYLGSEGYKDPWEEASKRKPDKATDAHVREAKKLVAQLREINSVQPLPEVV